ncbi:MAG: sensor histidine kinase [Planctomycetota bacterium]
MLLLGVNLVVLATQREPIVESLEREHRSRGEALALNLAARASHRLQAGRQESLQDLAEVFLAFDGVVSAAIVRPGLTAMAGMARDGGLEPLDRIPDAGSVLVREDPEADEFVAALPGANGVVRLRLDNGGLAATVSTIGTTIVGIAIAAVGVGFLLVFMVANAFTRPIHLLADLARRIRGGELGAQIDLARGDEIGELASAMNAMSIELGENAGRLQSAMENLESGNATLVQQHRQLVEQTRSLETLVASISEGVIFLGLDRKVRVANRAAEHILGVEPHSLGGLELPELELSEQDGRLIPLLETACDRAVVNERFHDELSLTAHLHTVTTVHDEQGEALGVLAVLRDLSKIRALETEQKELQDRLYQQDKMAIVGLLAASLAHEINTPLGTILLQTQRVALGLEGEDADALDVAGREVHRCQKIVGRLLDFSRLADSDPVLLDLSGPVELAISLAEAGLQRRGVTIRRTVAADVPLVRADPNQVEQILMNLIANAADAMPDGGVIAVRLHRADGGAEIRVRDGGRGVPPEHLAQIFDPFFTTKPRGKGTGLGLAICQRIVEEHHGTIAINPAKGGGTEVRVWLPEAEGERV